MLPVFNLLGALVGGAGSLVLMFQVVADAPLGAQILTAVVLGLAAVSFVAQFFQKPER